MILHPSSSFLSPNSFKGFKGHIMWLHLFQLLIILQATVCLSPNSFLNFPDKSSTSDKEERSYVILFVHQNLTLRSEQSQRGRPLNSTSREEAWRTYVDFASLYAWVWGPHWHMPFLLNIPHPNQSVAAQRKEAGSLACNRNYEPHSWLTSSSYLPTQHKIEKV